MILFFKNKWTGYIQTKALPEKDYKFNEDGLKNKFQKYFDIRKTQFDKQRDRSEKQLITIENWFKDEIENLHILNKNRNEEVMCFLEVDLSYDDSIHEFLQGKIGNKFF